MADWRVIGLEEQDAFMNLAIDEAVAESVGNADSPPTIRFYKWLPSAVSIGFFQNPDEEVYVKKCEKAGVSLVRRKSGGGTLFHTAEEEIGYSVIAPETYFPKGAVDSYSEICAMVIDAFQRMGIKTEYRPVTDIVVAPEVFDKDGEPLSGMKISYNTQTRRKGLLIQQGTVLVNPDMRKVQSLIRGDGHKMIGVKKIKRDFTVDDVYKAMLEAFTYGKKWQEGEWTLAEMMNAQTLVSNRYGTVEWNRMR